VLQFGDLIQATAHGAVHAHSSCAFLDILLDYMATGGTKWVKIQKSIERGWSKIPAEKTEEWRTAVEEEFSSEQFYEELMTRGLPYEEGIKAENGHKCLLVLGPSATGKTYCLQYIADGRLPLDACYKRSFVLDGARFRDVSKSWTRLKKAAIDEGFTGYTDGYDTCMKKATDALKLKLTTRLLNEGANLIMPDTCSSPKSVIKKCAMLAEAGYTLDVLVVIAPKSVCIARGTAREQFEGKKYSSKNWQKSMESVAEVINYLRVNGTTADMYVVDSSGVVEAQKEEAEARKAGREAAGNSAATSQVTGTSVHVRPQLILTLKGNERIEGRVLNNGEAVTYFALPLEEEEAQKVDANEDSDEEQKLEPAPKGCGDGDCAVL
jgi:hypothetical protein